MSARCGVDEFSKRMLTGFVPTMGALHEGHLSLIRQARTDNDLVIVSIFVNPTQFGAGEDLDKYPRPLERDLDLCEAQGADIVFTPQPQDIYPSGYQTYVDPGSLAEGLCGASRPGHFRGVATVVLKLLNITVPTRAYFGMKDYQQLRIIQRMVEDLDMPTQIVPMPTVREKDGLAMSSRNAYLSAEERVAAPVLIRALRHAAQIWAHGQRDVETLKKAALEVIATEPLVRVDYVQALDPVTLRPELGPGTGLLLAGAIFIGKTRLIDNVVVNGDGAELPSAPAQ